MRNPNLSLIIPAYNESDIIVKNVDELFCWLSDHMSEVSFEVVVINDGSTDDMGDILEAATLSRPWLRVAHHNRNRGRGKGVRTGFECCKGDYIICLDADLSYEPAIIPKLLSPLQSGAADVTLASAHHPDGGMINVPHQRAMLSKWGNSVLGMGFDKKLHTVTCVVRGFTREVIESLELVSDGKELHLEIIQKSELMGFHIAEIPAVLEWRDRSRGASKAKKIIPEIAIFKMRKTVLSHLVFNFVTNPGVLLFVPLLSLLAVMTATSVMLLSSFLQKVGTDLSLFQALRVTFIEGQLSLGVFLFSFITFMIFMMFYFLSFQSKRYFDEVYTLMMRMNARVKELEEKK